MFSEKPIDVSRRNFLISGAGALLATRELTAAPVSRAKHSSATNTKLKPDEIHFLEDFEKRCFRYFWEQWDDRTGLYMDRARNDGTPSS
ncbi:MAG: hypothetical protein M3Y24_07055, partial [Acidobacteriota bacterium]|nr:hypothetical protein [Acidobacteriota bacterium]